MYRTHLIGEVSKEILNKKVQLAGWIHTIRDHGGLIFIDLRDVSGKCQLVVDPKIAINLKSEYVIKIDGEVKLRDISNINKAIATGEVEVVVNSLEVLNKSLLLPFDIDDNSINESLKFKYRYLSLRNQNNLYKLKKRSELMQVMRNFLSKRDFIEVDTPILTKSTPEGARDFLVPSRVNDNKFYALPQSPQLFKQMLMCAGIDKYFQLAKCFRDEDLRADRQPEFLQLDIEASFVHKEDIMNLIESLLREIMPLFNIEVGSIPIMSYSEAMDLYGSDAPDIRYGMTLKNLSDITGSFEVFSKAVNSGGIVKAIVVSQNLTRKEIDDLTQEIKIFNAKGLAWIKLNEGGPSSLISKFFSDEELKKIIERVDAKVGDTILFVADKAEIVNSSLNYIRRTLAKRFNLAKGFKFLWVVNFPMFEFIDGKCKAVHHPFTSYEGEFSNSYDIVLNGVEIGGGSIRVHDVEKQYQIFEKLGISREEADKSFVHILSALKYGAPPHGGIALGFSRLLAIALGEDSIREVIPFPKTQKGICLTTEAPSDISDEDLSELKIKKIKNDKRDNIK